MRPLRMLAAVFAAAWLVLFAGHGAFAETAAPAVRGGIEAHPAFWTVKGPAGKAYLLGSIHLLPPNVRWRSPGITAAMAEADTFVLEVASDDVSKARIAEIIKSEGTLPPDRSLPSLLDEPARRDLTAAIKLTRLPPQVLMDKRPWLASLLLSLGQMMAQNYDPHSGLDEQTRQYGKANGKGFRYFETIDEQMALMKPADSAQELVQFKADLKELLTLQSHVGAIVDAWAHADSNKVWRITHDSMKDFPAAEKAFLDKRNANWVRQLGGMLKEKHVYFVVVGAAHMGGPSGLPSLLRKKGYKVEGP